jgi:pimeloyl-ACP methyl ester carboxylesterase
MSLLEVKTETLHGRSVTYAEAGEGPVLLLIHGMGGTFENWQEVVEPLSRRHKVIAPDLPGHGASGPGGGDYSIGAFAAGIRDLLLALGHRRATVVGHSLGGGIAMQFAYPARRRPLHQRHRGDRLEDRADAGARAGADRAAPER